MDKVSLVKSHLKLEHWKRLIAECQNSNLPVKQWCSNNDVSKDQYYYWLRKIREMTVSEIPVLFLFCGKRCDRIKALLWEGDGFLLLYKRLENGKFQWPRNEEELTPITWQQFRWLMEGLQIEQKKVISPAAYISENIARGVDITGF